MRNSFIFYASYAEALKELSGKDRLAIMDAIIAFAIEEREIELSGIPKAIFTLIRPMIEANIQRYENGKKGAEHGVKGGRPRKNPIGDIEENPKGIIQTNPIGVIPENPEKTPNITPNKDKESIERKKENNKESSSKSAGARVEVDFSLMTDGELALWGERAIDFSTAEGETLFYSYIAEIERRKKKAPSAWQGKIIRTDGRFEVLKSHQQIMDKFYLGLPLQEALKRFLRNCYVNGQLVLNDKLEDIILRLQENFDDESDMIKSLDRAISGGYFDIREGRE